MITRFRGLCRAAGFAAAADSLFEKLAAAYGHPDRHYHDLSHVAACVHIFDDLRTLAQAPLAVELALFYHDLIYDTHTPDNEARSARLARAELIAAGAAAELADEVASLVLATAHVALLQTPDQALVVDIDLAILGSAREDFDRYEAQIRREYAWVPEPLFWQKRSQILRGFLQRPQLFHTPQLRRRLEQAARANLARTVAAHGAD
jgi:predicted metal-dependent HD superfamily phosphohydrolase